MERPVVRARVRRAVLRLGCRGAPDRWAGQGYRPGTAPRISAAWPARSSALPLLAYLATWTGWFATSSGYDRNWAQLHGVNIPVISPLISLFQYNKAMLAFNTGLQKHHPYQSQPWTWLTISRPVSYYWSCPTSGHGVCAKGDAAEVLAIGTPVLWWGAILALLVCLGWWLTRRDWRAGAVLVGVAAGWLPWFAYAKRTQFYFYSVAFVPFLVLAVVLCLGLVMGSATASPARRAVGASLAGAFVLAVLLNFAYLYPLLSPQAIPALLAVPHVARWICPWPGSGSDAMPMAVTHRPGMLSPARRASRRPGPQQRPRSHLAGANDVRPHGLTAEVPPRPRPGPRNRPEPRAFAFLAMRSIGRHMRAEHVRRTARARAGHGAPPGRPLPRLKTNLQETFSIVAYNRITRPGRGKLPGTRATLGLADVYMGERRYEAE